MIVCKMRHLFDGVLFISGLCVLCLAAGNSRAGDKEELPDLLRAEPLKILPGDGELEKLLKERRNTALSVARLRFEQFKNVGVQLPELLEAEKLFITSELDLTDDAKERVKLYERYVKIAEKMEEYVKGQFKNGIASEAEFGQATYWRLSAQIQLVKAKENASGKGSSSGK